MSKTSADPRRLGCEQPLEHTHFEYMLYGSMQLSLRKSANIVDGVALELTADPFLRQYPK